MGPTSGAAGRLDVISKVSEAVAEAGNTNAGLTVCIVEKPAPGTRSTTLDIGSTAVPMPNLHRKQPTVDHGHAADGDLA